MPLYTIMIVRVAVTGQVRSEQVEFCLAANEWAHSCDRVLKVCHGTVSRTPTPVARNCAVKSARKNKADILIMIDDDMVPPPGFTERAFEFLTAQAEPSVVGSPYCCGPPHEETQVFLWAAAESHSKDVRWGSQHIPREMAARLTGYHRLSNIGTGCIAYDMRVFDKVKQPYFNYSYSDETMTQVIETEDCFAHRRMTQAGIPIYGDFDAWSTHCKIKAVGKPLEISHKDIDELYVAQAKADLLLAGQQGACGTVEE